MQETGVGRCPQCGCQFIYQNGAFNLTPIPPPDADVLSKWSVWETLQENGLISYQEDPDHNLSVGHREDVAAFADFCDLQGLILDVGCGPQVLPSYGAAYADTLVGIDPLPGDLGRQFSFVQGIGEYLPFRDNTFDRALFATSIDHMLSIPRVLKETWRVVKPDGTVNIWFQEPGPSRWEARWRYVLSLIREGKILTLLKKFPDGVKALLFSSDISLPDSTSKVPEYFQKLKKPESSIDHFHFKHPTEKQIVRQLRAAGLQILEIARYQEAHRFVRAQPNKQ
jgi:ubiquinone/menaquinone biosynthesis C-methylase UbiE